MRRLWSFALVALLALSWAAVETPRAAQAAGTCGRGGNYFNGYYSYGSAQHQYTGVSSYIVVRDGALCRGVSGFGNFTNAWVMIAGSGPRDWGQVGFERTSGYTLRWFAQYSTTDTLSTWYSVGGITNQIGTRHSFRVVYNRGLNRLDATIDSVLALRSGFDPKVSWGAQPWSPQFFAETGHTATDVPGRSTTRTTYSGVGVQRPSDGRVVRMPCILKGATESSRWARQATSCANFTMWTK